LSDYETQDVAFSFASLSGDVGEKGNLKSRILLNNITYILLKSGEVMALTTLQKVAIGIGVLVLVVVLVIGGFLIYKHDEQEAVAAQAASYAKGIADAQNATSQAANAQMIQAINNIAKLTEATNNQMANIRVTAQVEQKNIDSFNVDPTHPDADEKWANDTTKQLFSNIESDDPATAPILTLPAKVTK
jgi:hypothetical protein